ncbi:hypothetical protein GUJ93_ZPchr0005g14558 [Zizania palustris]|uniref:Uncharacterized protein n=1 Tax=Zizania palustris TaxID=103762 RepID=A0A8J5W100_ZIZPA|nr:hypothetical protein GUJ93_ZPchr0005g14558 [Zizania palustris]
MRQPRGSDGRFLDTKKEAGSDGERGASPPFATSHPSSNGTSINAVSVVPGGVAAMAERPASSGPAATPSFALCHHGPYLHGEPSRQCCVRVGRAQLRRLPPSWCC